MRPSCAVTILCLGLLPAVGLAAMPAASWGDAPAGIQAAASAPAAVPPSDAAAKHAKRTACLKNAKTKKLVGAAKTSYLKDCIAAP